MHACVLCVRVYMRAWPQRSHLLSACVSLRASPSSLSEGLRRKKKKALEEAVKLELGLPYLFAEKRPMRLASGWRGTL